MTLDPEYFETLTYNFPDEEKTNHAYELYASGIKPGYSTFIDEVTITAGYGRLDSSGAFEFPLNVDQETLKIIPLN